MDQRKSTESIREATEVAIPLLVTSSISPVIAILAIKDKPTFEFETEHSSINVNNGNNSTESPNNELPAARKGWKRYLGLFLTLISAVMFSLNALVVKVLKNIHPLNMGAWTFPISVLFTLPFLIHRTKFQKKPVLNTIFPFRKNFKINLFIFIRAFTSITALLLLYCAMHYLNVADALVIASSSTVFVYFIGWLFLGEKCGVVPIVTAVLALAGVAIITRPPMLTGAEEFDTDLIIGAALAFGCMLMVTIAIVAVRFLQNVYHAVLNFALYSWGEVQTIILALALGVLQVPESTTDILLMVTSGVLGLFAQTFLALALQCEHAGPVALVRTCEVIFAFIWQFLFLGVTPDLLSLVGAGLIVAGVVVTIMRKWISSLPETNHFRQQYSFLLM